MCHTHSEARTTTRGRKTEDGGKRGSERVSSQGDGELEEQMENLRATSVNVIRTTIYVDGAYALALFSCHSGEKNGERESR